MSNRRRRRPRYADAVLAASEQALAEGRLQPGQVYLVNVLHDAWCDLLAGQGPCNCSPDVRPPERVVNPEEN